MVYGHRKETIVETYKCYKCDGTGKLTVANTRLHININRDVTMPCFICHGKGELDWIENAMGGKAPIGMSGTSSSSGTAGTSGTSNVW